MRIADYKIPIARMLARPKSEGTQVFETRKNDQQITYLRGIYKGMQEPQVSLLLPEKWSTTKSTHQNTNLEVSAASVEHCMHGLLHLACSSAVSPCLLSH